MKFLKFPGWGGKKNMFKSRFPTKGRMTEYLLEAGGARVHSSYDKEELEGMVKEMLPPPGDVFYIETNNCLCP